MTSNPLVLQVNTLMARVGGSLIDKRKGTVLLSRAEWELLRKYTDQLHANWMAEIRKSSTPDETTDSREALSADLEKVQTELDVAMRELERYRANCTGRHGSQQQCSSVEPTRRIPPREFDIESHTGLYTESAAPRGKPCTCDNCLGSSASCRVEAGERLGDLWYCQKAARAAVKASGESRAEFERDRGFVCRCLKCGEQLVPYAGCPKCDVTAKNGNGEQK